MSITQILCIVYRVNTYLNNALVCSITNPLYLSSQHHIALQVLNQNATSKQIDIDYAEFVVTGLSR